MVSAPMSDVEQIWISDEDHDLVTPVVLEAQRVTKDAGGLDGDQISLMFAGIMMSFSAIPEKRMAEIILRAWVMKRELTNMVLNDNA